MIRYSIYSHHISCLRRITSNKLVIYVKEEISSIYYWDVHKVLFVFQIQIMNYKFIVMILIFHLLDLLTGILFFKLSDTSSEI